MTQAKFRVAIVGGGIGGLVCAAALSKASDIEVHIYEAARQFGEIGAGIGMYPRVWKVCQELGLEESLAAVTSGEGPQTFHMRKADAPEGLDFHETKDAGVFRSFHRAELQQAILKSIPPACKMHLIKRLVSFDEPENLEHPVTLTFEDGTTAACDLLIGADGIKSVVRASLFRKWAEGAAEGKQDVAETLLKHVDPVWTGVLAYRCVIPRERLEAQAPNHRVFQMPLVYAAKNRRVVTYCVSKGRLVNAVFMFTRPELEGSKCDGPTVASVSKEEVLDRFQGLEKDVVDLLHCIDNPMRWAIHALNPLPSFVSKRVVLLGDAAHAMTPNQGSGAGQAIEDAYVLSSMLTHQLCTKATIPDVLSIYDCIRRPLANMVLENSRSIGILWDFNLPGFTDEDVMARGEDGKYQPNMDILKQMGRKADELQEWIWKKPAQAERNQAIEMLESLPALAS